MNNPCNSPADTPASGNLANVGITSYQTYPDPGYWARTPHIQDYEGRLRSLQRHRRPVSLYVHLPFCSQKYSLGIPSLLYLAKSPALTFHYLSILEREFEGIYEAAGGKIPVNQFYLGKGSASCLSPLELGELMAICQQFFDFSHNMEATFCADPNDCTLERIQQLADLGFNRASFHLANLRQGQVKTDREGEKLFLRTRQLVERAHHCGFHSVELDVLLGLPGQSPLDVRGIIREISSIRPGRVSFRASMEARVKSSAPINPIELGGLFLASGDEIQESGYCQVGRNYFTLSGDELAYAMRQGMLRRSLLGYTARKSMEVLGAGMSATSFLEDHYFQNASAYKDYTELVEEDMYPLASSYELSRRDRMGKHLVDDLFSNLRVDPGKFEQEFGEDLESAVPGVHNRLGRWVDQGLLDGNRSFYRATPEGSFFAPKIATALDPSLASDPSNNVIKFFQALAEKEESALA